MVADAVKIPIKSGIPLCLTKIFKQKTNADSLNLKNVNKEFKTKKGVVHFD